MQNPLEGDDDALDQPWLKDMVDEQLLPLFHEDERKLRRAVRHFIRAAQDDSEVEEKLIELLETALEEGNDDTSASLMTTIILGEARSIAAIPILVRCLASEADETLQDAAHVALLRMGPVAVRRIVELMEDSDDRLLLRSGYGLLGQVGVLGDLDLTDEVRQFLRDRVEVERKKSAEETVIEELFRASALLGDLEQLDRLKAVLEDDFRGRNAGLQDIREMLEQNPEGVPFIATPPPWESRHGWLFEDEREEARVTRNRSGDISISLFSDGMEEDGGIVEEDSTADDAQEER